MNSFATTKRLHSGQGGFSGGAAVSAAMRQSNLAQGPELGPERMEAADRGPVLSVVAGEGALGAGAVPGAAGHGAADQQAGGAVEGDARGQVRGPGAAGCGRGAQPGVAQVCAYIGKQKIGNLKFLSIFSVYFLCQFIMSS